MIYAHRLSLGDALAHAMRNHPVRGRRFRLFVVASLPERILAIVPKEYRRILYYVERFADLPGATDLGPCWESVKPFLSQAEQSEVSSLYEALGIAGSPLDMMCRKALRGWFDESDKFVWSSLAHPFHNGWPPELWQQPEGFALESSVWRAAITPEDELAEIRRIEGLMDCILFRPQQACTVDPAVLAWNDGTVRRIAEGIYEERAFNRLPILADALLDAGCDNEQLIAHCRSEGPHARGCWAIDLLTGRR
jgi:hypothetical protein